MAMTTGRSVAFRSFSRQIRMDDTAAEDCSRQARQLITRVDVPQLGGLEPLRHQAGSERIEQSSR